MTHDLNVTLNEYTASGGIPTCPASQDPYVWARQKIAERTNKKNKIPFFYKESLRYIISKLGTLSYLNSETELINVKCIHANPERTIAKLKQENNIILPIISINQNTSTDDDNRRRYEANIVTETFWSEKKHRAFRIISLAPRPVTIEYGINIWSKYKGNLDQLVEQVRLLFNPHMVIKNPYTTVAQAFIDQETDSSSLEVGDRQERIIRRTFVVRLDAYVPNPQFLITSTGEIEEFNADATIY